MTSLGQALAQARGALQALALALPRVPKSRVDEEDGALTLWHWLEDNGTVVFPLIGVVIVALVIIAVRRSSVNQEGELADRRQQKDAIVRLMRARLSLTADQTASELQVNRYQAAALLEELVKEGSLIQGRLPGGVVNFRLKGF